MTPPATYRIAEYVRKIHPGIVGFDIDLTFAGALDRDHAEFHAVLLRAWDRDGKRLDVFPAGLSGLQQDRIASKGWELTREWLEAGRVEESRLGYRVTLEPVGVRALGESDG